MNKYIRGMKKITAFAAALVLTLSVYIPSYAANAAVTGVSVTGTTTSVSVSGTTGAGAQAVTLEILDGSSIVLVYSLSVDDNNSFSGTITDLRLVDGKTYQLKVADYDGGAWTTTEFTVGQSSSGSGSEGDDSGSETGESGSGSAGSGGSTSGGSSSSGTQTTPSQSGTSSQTATTVTESSTDTATNAATDGANVAKSTANTTVTKVEPTKAGEDDSSDVTADDESADEASGQDVDLSKDAADEEAAVSEEDIEEVDLTDAMVEVDESSEEALEAEAEEKIEALAKLVEKDDYELPAGVKEEYSGALKEAIEAGEKILVEVNASVVTSTDLGSDAKVLKEFVEASGVTSGSIIYLDLSVDLVTSGGKKVGSLTELDDEIEFNIPLTAEQLKLFDGKYPYIIRLHDGVADYLEATIKDGILSFKTGKFSSYALLASNEKLNIEEVTNTAQQAMNMTPVATAEVKSSSKVWVVIAVAAVIVICIIVISLIRKKGGKID
ncbi:MAG: hypothetical protein K6D96_08250 [Acetatifactor sp.]|nr:hypothetical protein [Acetatifactor sp.]